MGNGDNDFQFFMDPHDTSRNGIRRDTPSVSASELREWETDGVEPEAGAPPGANAGDD